MEEKKKKETKKRIKHFNEGMIKAVPRKKAKRLKAREKQELWKDKTFLPLK